MYSRNLYGRSYSEERPFVIPSNYRGNAFEEKVIVEEPDNDKKEKKNRAEEKTEGSRKIISLDQERSHFGKEAEREKTDKALDISEPAEAVQTVAGEKQTEKKANAGLFGNGYSLNFEDIVLIGILLLLSLQEGNEDLLLALALLLLIS
ncbi:MAG: hypothetical protein GX303_08910 [Clostridiales bacterium]|nr:hypothetical protein [Clostridiales bacterium]